MGRLSNDSNMSLELIEYMQRANIPEWYKIHYPLEFKNMSTETFH